jgi:branched-chain amino acid transport system ATP-binding protein
VLAHTDSAVVLEKGKVVLSGESRELLDAPDALGKYLGV